MKGNVAQVGDQEGDAGRRESEKQLSPSPQRPGDSPRDLTAGKARRAGGEKPVQWVLHVSIITV